MDKRQTGELADRVREQKQRLEAVERRSVAVIVRARQAVARSHAAREYASSLIVRARARWLGLTQVEGHRGEWPRVPISRPRDRASLLGDEPSRLTLEARCLPFRGGASPWSRRERGALGCYSRFGPITGPLRSGAGYYAIGVYPYRRAGTPIGAALAAGEDEAGQALWQLTIATSELPGLWVVVNREFRPA